MVSRTAGRYGLCGGWIIELEERALPGADVHFQHVVFSPVLGSLSFMWFLLQFRCLIG
jgi:hypothetical protein